MKYPVTAHLSDGSVDNHCFFDDDTGHVYMILPEGLLNYEPQHVTNFNSPTLLSDIVRQALANSMDDTYWTEVVIIVDGKKINVETIVTSVDGEPKGRMAEREAK